VSRLVSKLVRPVSFILLVAAALLGLYGLGHQNNFLLTQTDCRALQRVVAFALQRHSPYDRALVDQAFIDAPFKVHELFYPPSFIALTAPLTLVGDLGIRVLALVAQLASFWFVLSQARRLPVRMQALAFLSPVAFLALFQTVRFGQISCIAAAMAILLWKQLEGQRLEGLRTTLFEGVLLFIATVKPSSTVAVLVYLVLERRFSLLAVAGLLHGACTVVAWLLTGIDPISLCAQWLHTIPKYREFAVNSPAESVVYGLSVLVHRLTGAVVSLDILALPLTCLVWRLRDRWTTPDVIALLFLISYMVGTPHAYDFFMLLPALIRTITRSLGVLIYAAVSLMLLVPQRVLQPVFGPEFESVLRVLAPVVLFLFLSFSPQAYRSRQTAHLR
jgi:hypothetical protein